MQKHVKINFSKIIIIFFQGQTVREQPQSDFSKILFSKSMAKELEPFCERIYFFPKKGVFGVK